MNRQDILEQCKEHTLFSWSANGHIHPMAIVDAQGIELIDADGNTYVDFFSGAASVTIGYSHPRMRQAMKKLSDELLFVSPSAATVVRAKLGQKLSALTPPSIQKFFFVNGGAEANENAVRAARLYTGRQKILTRYRSYHGATNLTVNLTGDIRRIANEPAPPGLIHTFDPAPYEYRFGQSEHEIADNHLIYLKELIEYEGPESIAAYLIETIPGTNGVLIPPAGYLARLHELLKSYGILLILDEVMCGFARTGKMFAFEHFDVVPDMITMAKGLTSSYAPLGAVGLSREIANYFEENVFWGGLTYHAHPWCLGVALENISIIEDEHMIENTKKNEAVLREQLTQWKSELSIVKDFRLIGLMGAIDLQCPDGRAFSPYGQNSQWSILLSSLCKAEGVVAHVRWSLMHTMPPLCITAEQLVQSCQKTCTALRTLEKTMQEKGF